MGFRSKRKRMELAPVIYSLLCDVEVVGDGYLSTNQTYDSLEGFAPDYGLTAISLYPKCQLVDPDSPYAAAVCNKNLVSFEWAEVTSKGEQIVCTNNVVADSKSYSVITTGDRKGQLTIGKNGEPGVPRAFRFTGYYNENGFTCKFQKSVPFITQDVSSPGVTLAIDSDKAVAYNPLRMPREQTITALAMKGERDVTDDERLKLLWYRRSTAGTETLLTGNQDMENVEVVSTVKTANGSIKELVIDRELIGEGETYVCYALWRDDKVFPAAPTEVDARQYTTIQRQFPTLYCDIVGDGLRVSTDKIHVKAVVSDNQGVIDPDVWSQYLYASWKVGDGSTDTEVARGTEVDLDMQPGKSFFCDIEEREEYKVLVADTGEWLVDDDGNALVVRANED